MFLFIMCEAPPQNLTIFRPFLAFLLYFTWQIGHISKNPNFGK